MTYNCAKSCGTCDYLNNNYTNKDSPGPDLMFNGLDITSDNSGDLTLSGEFKNGVSQSVTTLSPQPIDTFVKETTITLKMDQTLKEWIIRKLKTTEEEKKTTKKVESVDNSRTASRKKFSCSSN
tara:strand:- start:824 stop:1195 length:372 start_codon:yes stop_codon:yes gene_type:complete